MANIESISYWQRVYTKNNAVVIVFRDGKETFYWKTRATATTLTRTSTNNIVPFRFDGSWSIYQGETY